MRPALLGIIGCGAMGRLIARISVNSCRPIVLAGFSRTYGARQGARAGARNVPVLGLQRLAKQRLLVEATKCRRHAG